MNLTSLVWYKVLPAKFGGQKAIVQLGEAIARRSPFEMICSSNNSKGDSFIAKRILPTDKKQIFNPLVWKKIEKELLLEKTTHLIVEHCYYGLFGRRMQKKHGIRFIIRHHNIEAKRFREMNGKGWQLLRAYEKWVSQKADLNVYLAEEDKQYAIRNYNIKEEKCFVIPYFIIQSGNKYNKEEAKQQLRKKYSINDAAKILVFNGTLDYEPNAAAVRNIFDKIVPLLHSSGMSSHIFINGRNKFKHFQYLNTYSSPFVTMTGEVDDIEIFFAAADVFINPVDTGGGVQTKTLEALSHGCKVVCFDHMLNGVPATSVGKNVFAAAKNDWEQFGKAISQAITVTGESNKIFDDTNAQAATIESFIARLESM